MISTKGKSHVDMGSSPIHDSSSEGLHSIAKKEALRTDKQTG